MTLFTKDIFTLHILCNSLSLDSLFIYVFVLLPFILAYAKVILKQIKWCVKPFCRYFH